MQSQTVRELYRYLEDRDLGEAVLRIYLLVSNCLNPHLGSPSVRAVEEGYKVMMVMHNILDLGSSPRKGEAVVDMLSFMNNYYHFYGEECKGIVLRQLCNQQLCTLPTLIFLFSHQSQHPHLLYPLLLNLTYHQHYYQMLKLTTVHAYDCLREMKKSEKFGEIAGIVEKLLKYYEARITLRELSVETGQL
jgi:hypothetical protein